MSSFVDHDLALVAQARLDERVVFLGGKERKEGVSSFVDHHLTLVAQARLDERVIFLGIKKRKRV